MRLIFSEQAWEDYLYWQANDAKLLAQLNGLIKECARSPFAGTGKPGAFARTPVKLVVAAADARASAGLSTDGGWPAHRAVPLSLLTPAPFSRLPASPSAFI